MAQQKESKAIVKKETVDVVAARVRQFQESGQLHLPPNYSAENAMKSAWLLIQETTDKDKRPALQVCTKESIANALLYMVVQALNPAKKQCYFVVYGKQLVCQRSYFGSMAVAKMVDETIDDIVAEVVYQGDKFRYQIDKGKKYVMEHEQDIENVGKPIIAAYAMVLDKNGDVTRTEIMTMEQIKQAWKQSQTKPVNDDGSLNAKSTHAKFTADMAKKTVINKVCKPIINASSDSNLLLEAVQYSEDVQAEHETRQEIEENANQEMIDVTPEPSQGPDPEEGPPVDAGSPEEWGGEPTEEEKAEIEAREMAEAEGQATGTDGPGF